MPRTVLCALLCVVLLVGCGGSTSPPPPDRSSPTGGAPASGPPGRAAGTPLAEAAPIARRRGTIDQEPVSLALLPVRRRGGTVQLEFVLTTTSETDARVAGAFDDGVRQKLTDPDAFGYEQDSLDGISLIDGANRKRYLVARDRFGRCVCDQDLLDAEARAGTPLRLSATFGAPPQDVRTVDVVVPRFGTFADVPLA